ncbi:MAG: AMP-binding protein [Novosphingobium sp.]|nr:AMP-binding protein [Novosphingobium sp.]
MALDRRAAELMVQGRDLSWLLDQWVQRTPDKTFLIWAPFEGEHRQWTYAQFDADVRRLAGGLALWGIEKGSRLLIHLENCPELLMAHFACAQLGAVAVLTNTRSVERELSYFVELTEATAAITQAQFVEAVAAAGPDLKFLALTAGCPGADSTASNILPWDVLLQTEPLLVARDPEPLLDLRVQFTSGTTSRPKAVLSTHANTLFAAQQTAKAYGLQHDDVCQVFVPLFHNNGLATLAMSTLWAGGTVLLQPRFSASNFWGPALKYGATWTSLPGSFFLSALAGYEVPDHRFRFWFIAVLPEVEARYRVKTRGHWGMTETITIPIVGDPDHPGPPGNIGRPAPGNEIAIRRGDGSDCGPDETGDLYVRGVRGITLFKEYLKDPEATTRSFDENGWFSTGDRIRIDGQGCLFFADRSKDILRVGGENVAASEIEAVILRTGWVSECAVVGQKHDMLDEVPVAFVVAAADAPQHLESKLIQCCREQLADFKVIRDVHVVEDLPRSTLQKIAKHRLRESLPLIGGSRRRGAL